MTQIPVFYGLRPRWTGWDRLFKLHIIEDSIAGAYVCGQVYDNASGSMQLGPLMAILGRRIVRKRAEREAAYKSLIPGSPEFLAADARNFMLKGTEIERVIINPKRALWTAGVNNSGSIYFKLWSGKKWRFILIDQQDIAWLEEALVNAFGSNRIERISKSPQSWSLWPK